MSKVRVIYNPDKTVAIIHPAPKSRRILYEFEHEWLERVFAKATLEGAIYDDIDISSLPQSREDRNAWEGEKGKGVKINQVKATTLREKMVNDAKVKSKIQEMAIKELKKTGELPDDYK